MRYNVILTDEAQAHLVCLNHDEPGAYRKALRLITELYEHPRTGTGHPEQLKGHPQGRWSRRITRKHRLVYEIHETEILVLVLTAYGHYSDR